MLLLLLQLGFALQSYNKPANLSPNLLRYSDMTTMRLWATPPLLLLLSVSVALIVLLPVATTARSHEKELKVDEGLHPTATTVHTSLPPGTGGAGGGPGRDGQDGTPGAGASPEGGRSSCSCHSPPGKGGSGGGGGGGGSGGNGGTSSCHCGSRGGGGGGRGGSGGGGGGGGGGGDGGGGGGGDGDYDYYGWVGGWDAQADEGGKN